MDRHWHEDLANIKQMILKMGALVEEQVQGALRALMNRDSQLARKIIDADQTVNDLDIEIDEKCTQLLALQQPAARDLRLVNRAPLWIPFLRQKLRNCFIH